MEQPDFSSQLLAGNAAIPGIIATASNPVQPKAGMFGGGGGFGLRQALAFGLAGLVSRHNPMLLQGLMAAQMEKRKQAEQDAQYQRERQDKRSDFTFEQDYKAAHPDPTNAGSMDAIRAEYLNPNTSPERRAQLEPLVLQPQLQMVPGVGLVSVPRASAAPKPLTDEDILKMGGQTGSAPSGGFSY